MEGRQRGAALALHAGEHCRPSSGIIDIVRRLWWTAALTGS
jgi:hypothetical protein